MNGKTANLSINQRPHYALTTLLQETPSNIYK